MVEANEMDPVFDVNKQFGGKTICNTPLQFVNCDTCNLCVPDSFHNNYLAYLFQTELSMSTTLQYCLETFN